MPLPDSIENLALQAGISTADHFEDLNRSVEEIERHAAQLARSHGPALVAVLVDLVDNLRHAAHGAQRINATERGGLQRRLGDISRQLEEYVQDEQSTMATLEALLVEVERRNRRSHAKTSAAVTKARKLVDQFYLDSEGL